MQPPIEDVVNVQLGGKKIVSMMVHCKSVRNGEDFGNCWLVKLVTAAVSTFAKDAVVLPTVSKA